MQGAAEARTIQQAFRARLKKRPPLLYGIVDLQADGEAAAALVLLALLRGGVDCLQLRGKEIPAIAFERFLRDMLPAAEAAGVPLLVNDRIDVALSAGAHGAHVGQDDMPPAEARALLGELPILGYSTHSLSELKAAQRLPVDYLGFGAIFATDSRNASRVVGPQALTPAGAASTLPLIAIGGIVPERLADIPLDAVAGVAAISAFANPDRTTDVLRRFRDSLRGE